METKIPTYDELLQKVKQQEKELLKFKNLIDFTPVAMHFYTLNNEDNLIFTGSNASADKILGIKHEK